VVPDELRELLKAVHPEVSAPLAAVEPTLDVILVWHVLVPSVVF
jgi:hypothetical protein